MLLEDMKKLEQAVARGENIKPTARHAQDGLTGDIHRVTYDFYVLAIDRGIAEYQLSWLYSLTRPDWRWRLTFKQYVETQEGILSLMEYPHRDSSGACEALEGHTLLSELLKENGLELEFSPCSGNDYAFGNPNYALTDRTKVWLKAKS